MPVARLGLLQGFWVLQLKGMAGNPGWLSAAAAPLHCRDTAAPAQLRVLEGEEKIASGVQSDELHLASSAQSLKSHARFAWLSLSNR